MAFVQVLAEPGLLNDVARTKITWVERLAAREPFVLTVIKANAVLAQFPAQINILIIDDRWKI